MTPSTLTAPLMTPIPREAYREPLPEKAVEMLATYLRTKLAPVFIAFGPLGKRTYPSLQGAIDSLPAGGTVEIPPGWHGLTETLVVPSLINLQGSGLGNTRLVGMNGNMDVVRIAGNGVGLFDLDVTRNVEKVADTNGKGIVIDGGRFNLRLTRVGIHRHGYGLFSDQKERSFFTYLTDVTFSASRFAHIDATNVHEVSVNGVQGYQSAGAGFVFSGSSGLYLDQLLFYGAERNGLAFHECINLRLSNLVADSVEGNCIYVGGGNRVSIDHSWLSSAGVNQRNAKRWDEPWPISDVVNWASHGVFFNHCGLASISDSTIIQNTGDGIHVEGGGTFQAIGNKCTRNGMRFWEEPVDAGIYIKDVDHLQLIGNQNDDNGFGIVVEGSGLSTVIRDNDNAGNRHRGMRDRRKVPRRKMRSVGGNVG